MSRTFSDKTSYYLYDGYEEIGSYDEDQNNIDLKVLSATEGSIPIAIEIGKQHYSPLISSQGHIVGLVNMDSGSLSDESFLTMFGDDLAKNPLSPWRFCGKRHEVETLGIIDFGCRFYHPKSAQWLTQDPIGEIDGPNLYAYVSNNPTCCIDRFGLFMDGFEFGSMWGAFQDKCCLSANQVADYNIRFNGVARAIGGAFETAAGAGMAAVGSASGIAVPVGCAIAAKDRSVWMHYPKLDRKWIGLV
jgi:RHS repeat-associated protein